MVAPAEVGVHFKSHNQRVPASSAVRYMIASLSNLSIDPWSLGQVYTQFCFHSARRLTWEVNPTSSFQNMIGVISRKVCSNSVKYYLSAETFSNPIRPLNKSNPVSMNASENMPISGRISGYAERKSNSCDVKTNGGKNCLGVWHCVDLTLFHPSDVD